MWESNRFFVYTPAQGFFRFKSRPMWFQNFFIHDSCLIFLFFQYLHIPRFTYRRKWASIVRFECGMTFCPYFYPFHAYTYKNIDHPRLPFGKPFLLHHIRLFSSSLSSSLLVFPLHSNACHTQSCSQWGTSSF